MVSKVRDKVLGIAADHSTVKMIVLHSGSCKIVKRRSQLLKRDLNDPLNTVSCVNADVFTSGSDACQLTIQCILSTISTFSG